LRGKFSSCKILEKEFCIELLYHEITYTLNGQNQKQPISVHHSNVFVVVVVVVVQPEYSESSDEHIRVYDRVVTVILRFNKQQLKK